METNQEWPESTLALRLNILESGAAKVLSIFWFFRRKHYKRKGISIFSRTFRQNWRSSFSAVEVGVNREITVGYCRSRHPDQKFAWCGSETPLLQDEDHSECRPHSFSGLCHMRSGTSPERNRSGPELAASEETRQVGRERA